MSKLTIEVSRKALIIKYWGCNNSMDVARIIGVVLDACHIAVSQPMRRRIRMTTTDVFPRSQDMRNKSLIAKP